MPNHLEFDVFENMSTNEIVDTVSRNMSAISIENEQFQGRGSYFDETIGHIEDLIMEDEFQNIQQTFLEKYWETFEPVQENKLIYMDIFHEYNEAIETYIAENLTKRMPSFSMENFLKQLSEQSSQLEGEVFEVLSTFTDFLAFKEMFLDYRAVKEGKVEDLSSRISITAVPFNYTNSLQENDWEK